MKIKVPLGPPAAYLSCFPTLTTPSRPPRATKSRGQSASCAPTSFTLDELQRKPHQYVLAYAHLARPLLLLGVLLRPFFLLGGPPLPRLLSWSGGAWSPLFMGACLARGSVAGWRVRRLCPSSAGEEERACHGQGEPPQPFGREGGGAVRKTTGEGQRRKSRGVGDAWGGMRVAAASCKRTKNSHDQYKGNEEKMDFPPQLKRSGASPRKQVYTHSAVERDVQTARMQRGGGRCAGHVNTAQERHGRTALELFFLVLSGVLAFEEYCGKISIQERKNSKYKNKKHLNLKPRDVKQQLQQ